MADTFQYKKSELNSLINADSTPNLRVAVNNQSAKAFDNLGKIIGQYSQARVQQLDTKRQLTEEEVQKLDAQSYVDSSARMATYYSQYVDDSNRAGNDKDKQELVHNYFIESMGMEVEGLSPKVRERLALHANGMVKNADTNFSNQVLQIDRTEFVDGLSYQAPAFLDMDKATQKEVYQEFMSQGEDLGISKGDFGSAWVSTIANHKINSLDVEKMVLDNDYGQLDDIRTALSNIQEIDPKTNKDTIKVTKQLDVLKNQIDANVTQNINLALSSNEGYNKFRERLEFATDNGAINEDRRDLYLRKWKDNNTVAQNVIAGQTGTIFSASKGMVNLSSFDGTKLKTPLTNMTKQSTLEALQRGDTEFLTYQKEKNSKLFETTVNEYMRDLTSYMGDVSSSDAKTPEEEQKKAQAIQQLMKNMDTVNFIGSSKLDSETKLKARGTQLCSQGYMDCEKFRQSINMYEPELAPKSDPYIKDLYSQELDNETTKKIREDYSVFVSSGMDKKLAFEEASRIHTYIESEDTSVSFSGSLNQSLTQAGLQDNSFGAFLDNVAKSEDYLNTNVEQKILEFQARPDAKAHYSDGMMILSSSDGTRLPVVLPSGLLSRVAKTTNEEKNSTKYADTSNFDRVVSNAATFASKDVLGFWNTMSDIGFLLKQSLEPVTGVYRSQVDNYNNRIMPLVEKQKQLVDKFLGDAFLDETSFEKAYSNFAKESSKLLKSLPVTQIYKAADYPESSKNLSRWEEIKKRELSTLEDIREWMKDTLSVFPNADSVGQQTEELLNRQ